MNGVDGKVAIVTGAARGMGEQAARRLVAEGARVVIADVLEVEGKQVADELGEAAVFMRLDVSDEENWQQVVAATEEQLGSVDILINNAGILSFAVVHRLELTEYERLVRVNQIGVFLGMKSVVRAMERAGGGAIVNVSSVEGLGGGPGLIAYTGTKFAVRGMTKAAAWDLGRKNIRVNSIHPGAIKTPMTDAQGAGTPEAQEFIGSKTALKRTGDASEVAAVMVFLVSDDASYVTGAEIAVDGGVSAGSGFAA